MLIKLNLFLILKLNRYKFFKQLKIIKLKKKGKKIIVIEEYYLINIHFSFFVIKLFIHK